MDWAQILVIILAIFFAIFLFLAIALAVLLIKITRQIKVAAASAERTVAAIEGAVAGLSKTSLPLTLLRTGLKRVMKTRSKKPKVSKDKKSTGGNNE
jgi:hypothetical protein